MRLEVLNAAGLDTADALARLMGSEALLGRLLGKFAADENCARLAAAAEKDDADAALEAGADGVHVGAEDAPVAAIRARAGKGFIIGATAKTAKQAQRAEREGADYLGVGAVFPSPTKQNAVRITARQLCDICASVSIPAAAIGGITADNLEALRGGGMAGIAVVSAIFSAEDEETAARDLLRRVNDLLEEGA